MNEYLFVPSIVCWSLIEYITFHHSYVFDHSYVVDTLDHPIILSSLVHTLRVDFHIDRLETNNTILRVIFPWMIPKTYHQYDSDNCISSITHKYIPDDLCIPVVSCTPNLIFLTIAPPNHLSSFVLSLSWSLYLDDLRNTWSYVSYHFILLIILRSCQCVVVIPSLSWSPVHHVILCILSLVLSSFVVSSSRCSLSSFVVSLSITYHPFDHSSLVLSSLFFRPRDT